jgi:hypothetical protein
LHTKGAGHKDVVGAGPVCCDGIVGRAKGVHEQVVSRDVPGCLVIDVVIPWNTAKVVEVVLFYDVVIAI